MWRRKQQHGGKSGRVLVFDVGTSSVKAAVFDLTGALLAEAEEPHRTTNKEAGFVEQDPRDWWRGAVRARRRLGKLDGLCGISLSGTMQCVIPLNSAGEPVRPAIMYSDSRAQAQFAALEPTLQRLDAAAIVGNTSNEFLAAFKMAWLRECEPRAFERSKTLHSGGKDYIAYLLTRRHVTDATAATTVGLMDIRTRQWSSELLSAFRLAPTQLPEIAEAGDQIGTVCVSAANELGVPVGLPVWNGLGDAGASTVASGVRESGDAYVYLGTTAWVARIAATDTLTLPSRVFALAHPDPDKTIEVAPLLSGGDCVQWALELLSTDLQTMNARMGEIDRNPPAMMFLPYLKGERSPFVDTEVRGGFLFADRTDGAAQCFYAVMEGVAFSLKANMDALGANCRRVRLLGGGGKSAVWPQLIADALEMEVEVAAVPGAATAFGAYCVAAESLGGETGAQSSAVRAAPRPDRIERARFRYAQFSQATAFARELARESQARAEPRLARQA